MGRPVSRPLRFILPLVALATLATPAGIQADQAWKLQTIDPQKIVTAEKCGACHTSAFKVWKKSVHATGFSTLHRKTTAEEIAHRLGFRLIKRNSVCLECHYTPQVTAGGVVKAIAGVSCERCHGAARDWINIHNKYGEGKTYLTETPEHKRQRIEQSRAAGMFRPSSIYDVVQNCYRCHTVPNEELVNKGKHGSGSDFVLVDWYQKIQHNFLQSLREGDGTKQRDLTAAQKRVLWVVGWGLDLEHSYRGMAKATKTGVFLSAMERRASNARGRLEDIQTMMRIPQVDSMLMVAGKVPVAPGRGKEQLAAAQEIGAMNKRFIASHDGAGLAPLDTLVGGWRPAPPVEVEAGSDSLAATLSASAGTVQGTAVAHVHDPPKHGSTGVAACSKCHGEQGGWWISDAHANAYRRLGTRRAQQIAIFYGLSPANARSTDHLCLDCHVGRGAHSARDGVPCEGCHGPGKDYDKPHQEGDRALGLERPGYKAGLRLGLTDLRHPDPMAVACASCHYITQDRLLSSGHKSGADFDIVAALGRIKHWKVTLAGAAELKAAYGREIQRRGPIPNVAVAELPKEADGGGGAGAAGAAGGSEGFFSPGPNIQLDPFPDIPKNATIEEIMVIVRDRLKAMNKAKGGS